MCSINIGDKEGRRLGALQEPRALGLTQNTGKSSERSEVELSLKK